MARTSPFEFLQQVREEANKITWPSRRETIVTTVMVMIMVALAAGFFLVVDAVLKWAIDRALFGL